MPSLRKSEDLADFKRRVGHLVPDAPRQWGKMNAHQMVCHVSDQMRAALGDLPTKDRSTWFLRNVLSFLVIRVGVPAPKGKVQTAPEMKTAQPTEWQADLDTLDELMDRVAVATETARHPMFGELSPEKWGVLSARHLDHHLRQFGV